MAKRKRSRNELLKAGGKTSQDPSSEKSNKPKEDETKGNDSASKKAKHSPSKSRQSKSKSNQNDSTPKKQPDTADGSSEGNGEAKWSKSKKKRMRNLLAKQRRQSAENAAIMTAQRNQTRQKSSRKGTDTQDNAAPSDSNQSPMQAKASAASSRKSRSSLQEEFKSRLSGSRFRILNEELYTTTSQDSFARFQNNPDLFQQYHDGFRHQVENWPINPVDVLVQWIHKKYKTRKRCVIADFGCGDAQLAKDLKTQDESGNDSKPAKYKVHSFDLVANGNPYITPCDMANVPLPDQSVDACIFCLSLMGTNLADFIREAHRVLKPDGRVKIAEVRSRIDANGSLQEFKEMLDKLGFACITTDRSNKMFLTMELKKNGNDPDGNLKYTAKPCIYKRR